MEWYKLVFKQNQPIHIGSTRWGVINETEVFIPGWTMWGALTNQFLIENEFKDIEKSKKIFERITNFYPMIGQEKEDHCQLQPLFPQYKGGIFSLGDYPEEEFKFKFVDTLVSTAVEPLLRSAKDESLHEFEYILPKSKLDSKEKSRKNNIDQLYWMGLIGFENDIHEKIKSFLKTHLKVYIGGDSKYGFGEMELLNLSIDVREELCEWNITENGTASIKPDFPLRQFFKFSNEIKFEGELKLLSEFDFTQNIPRVQEAGYFINVGSKFSDFNGIDLSKYRLIKGKFIELD
ncbi:hypothetical protein [Caldisericum sp.]|uniref:hypothetical protein n=1 Tax=Caldisericum sp. TaxID=2499687 RepID=UPI003D09DD11